MKYIIMFPIRSQRKRFNLKSKIEKFRIQESNFFNNIVAEFENKFDDFAAQQSEVKGIIKFYPDFLTKNKIKYLEGFGSDMPKKEDYEKQVKTLYENYIFKQIETNLG